MKLADKLYDLVLRLQGSARMVGCDVDASISTCGLPNGRYTLVIEIVPGREYPVVSDCTIVHHCAYKGISITSKMV